MSQYCTPTDVVTYALPATALQTLTNTDQVNACIAASEEADSYLRGRYALPLSAWGADVTRYTTYIAAYLLMSKRGWQPVSGADMSVKENYYRAIGWPDRPGTGWFPGVQRQAIHPDVTPAVTQPGDPVHDLPQVRTDPQRGWPQFNNGGTPTVG